MPVWWLRDFHDDDLDQAVQIWDQSRQGEEPIFSIAEVVAAARAGQPAVVAAIEDELVGMAVAQAEGERAWVLLVALAAGWRSRGIGSSLLAALEERLRSLGKAWRPVAHPARLRATYNRNDGVMHLLGALDLTTGKIYYRIRKRKRSREMLSFLKTLRRRWPGDRLYVVLDNFSTHKHHTLRQWAADNDVDLVFTPTYGSWLNWIESEFAALRHFALNGTDHRTHHEQNTAIAAYIRWHNHQAEPKTSFAASSPIRSWTSYPAKVA